MAPTVATEFSSITQTLGVPIALILGYLIVALGYMASKVFSSHQLESWSKVELHEAFISTIYAAVILALVSVYDTFLDGLGDYGIGTSITNMAEISKNMVSISIGLIMKISGLFSYSSILGWFSYSPSAQLDALGITKWYAHVMASPLTFFTSLLDPLTMLQTVAVGGLMAIIAQYIFLIIIKDLFISYMVPFALVLRALPITRRLGSTLLAVFVGAYFFYPLGLGLMMSSVCNLSYYSPTDEMSLLGSSISAFVISIMDTLKKLLDLFVLPLYIWNLTDKIVTNTCGSWFFYQCSTPVAYLVITFLWIIIWTVDVILSFINLIIGLVGLIASLLSTLALLASDQDRFATLMTDSIMGFVAGYSTLYAFAFFTPIFSFMFMLLGIRSMLTLFGGDEVIVSMLYFI